MNTLIVYVYSGFNKKCNRIKRSPNIKTSYIYIYIYIYIYKFIISQTHRIKYNAKLQYRGYMFRPSMVIFRPYFLTSPSHLKYFK